MVSKDQITRCKSSSHSIIFVIFLFNEFIRRILDGFKRSGIFLLTFFSSGQECAEWRGQRSAGAAPADAPSLGRPGELIMMMRVMMMMMMMMMMIIIMLKVGDPMDEDTFCGAVNSRVHYDKVTDNDNCTDDDDNGAAADDSDDDDDDDNDQGDVLHPTGPGGPGCQAAHGGGGLQPQPRPAQQARLLHPAHHHHRGGRRSQVLLAVTLLINTHVLDACRRRSLAR